MREICTLNENFISLEDYQDQCYEEAKEKADSFLNKSKFMIAPDVRSTIFYVITFGCVACFVAYVMNGMLCSLLLGVVIIFCYVMLIHISGNVAHSHNEKLRAETDKYFDEAKKKVEIYEKKLKSEIEEKIQLYKDEPVVIECSQRASIYFREQISRADRSEFVEEIYESYVISVCKNRIDMPCKNIIYDDGMYNCNFDKMRYKQLDVISMGAVAKLIAQNVTNYIDKYYKKDISGGDCKVEYRGPVMGENKTLRTDTGFFLDSQNYYWTVSIVYKAKNAGCRQRV